MMMRCHIKLVKLVATAAARLILPQRVAHFAACKTHIVKNYNFLTFQMIQIHNFNLPPLLILFTGDLSAADLFKKAREIQNTRFSTWTLPALLSKNEIGEKLGQF